MAPKRERPERPGSRTTRSNRRLVSPASTGRSRAHAPKARIAVADVVGLGRLERPTSPLSGVRSNHLSYRPEGLISALPAAVQARLAKEREKETGGARQTGRGD